MKLALLNKAKTETGKVDLPIQFEEEFRPDLISRAAWTISMNKKQAYGAFPMAGKGYSSYVSKRRRAYRGIYGSGTSRTPRKIMSRRGRRLHYVGAFAPMTVGGRRAHPPKADKVWDRKINIKERRKAIRSAISATIMPEVVKERGHNVPKEYPFVISDEINKLNKTKDVQLLLIKLGFEAELKRTEDRKVRAGKGKARGRKYKSKTGILIVVGSKCELQKAGRNILGVDVAYVKDLNAEILAPGGSAGRITVWTKSAIDTLGKDKLFM
jgi:large subunit ribosomal protein L4e